VSRDEDRRRSSKSFALSERSLWLLTYTLSVDSIAKTKLARAVSKPAKYKEQGLKDIVGKQSSAPPKKRVKVIIDLEAQWQKEASMVQAYEPLPVGSLPLCFGQQLIVVVSTIGWVVHRFRGVLTHPSIK